MPSHATRPYPISTSARKLKTASFWFAVVGIGCLLLADINISRPDPWHELSLMGQGLMNPHIHSWPETLASIATTLSFALQGIVLAAVSGFILSLGYRWLPVRTLCAFIRSIHELFWALLFIQIVGLSTLTGLLAIAIPYAGTLAKIYGELFEETNPAPINNLAPASSLSKFFYTTLPLAWQPLVAYTRYRFECSIRSSVVLGFIGFPTLGFHLESALSDGHYNEAAALLYILFFVVLSFQIWLRARLLPIYLIASIWYLPPHAATSWETAMRFLTQDIIPAPLRGSWTDSTLNDLSGWFDYLWQNQLWPGLIDTLVLSQIAVVATGLITLICFPLNSTLFFSPIARRLGDSILIFSRSTPEYLLAFIGLLLLGPSMLPAVIALAIHNGAIIAHLVGRYSDQLVLRVDTNQGLDRYFYDVLPRVYRQFLAFLFYRWEVILRETAILGILGITTLGFYIDSAFEEFRFDRAAVLILASAILNMSVDYCARTLRRRMHLKTTPETV